uniref:Uncharacterized protein n=1 Tax=Rhizophora mucronata TaxID=61149 RepID=A0A2P2NPZ5_RHIMU
MLCIYFIIFLLSMLNSWHMKSTLST